MQKTQLYRFVCAGLFTKTISCIVFLLIVSGIYGQKNFKPGYVLNTTGDTLRGEIDFQNWEINPNRISFRKTPTEDAELLTPDKISSFYVGDEYYQSGTVEVEKSPNSLEDLTYSPEFELKTESVFLRTLILGKKSLFYYRDQSGIEHFYIKNENGFEALLYKKYYKDAPSGANASRQVIGNNAYASRLIVYLGDCLDLQTKIRNATYTTSDLMALFNEYYSCQNITWSYRMKTQKGTLEFGILAGLSFTKPSFKSQASIFNHLTLTDYPYTSSFTGGIFLDFVLPRSRGKWSFNNELIYSSYTAKGLSEVKFAENQYTRRTTRIGGAYIKLIDMARYRYIAGKLILFVNAGISNGIAISERNNWKIESKFNTSLTTTEKPALETFRKHEQGYIIGAGAKIDRYSLELRMEKSNGMSGFNGLKSTITRFNLICGFRI